MTSDLPGEGAALVVPEWVVWDDGLDQEEAITVGLWNNPGYQELLADLQLTQADLIQAAQLTNPQVMTMLPLGPKQWEFTLLLPLEALWLRPQRVAIAELESERVAERLVQDGLNVVRDVRLSFIDWQLAEERSALAAELAELRDEQARIAQARLDAGDIAELDVMPIRIDALVGQGETASEAYRVDLARNRLQHVLGLQLSELSFELTPMSSGQEFEFAVDDLVAEAIASRPDLRAIELAWIAAQNRAEMARRDVWRVAGILPDINARGRKGFEAGPGLNFTLPLFHQNQGEVAQAEAQAERLRRQYVTRRDRAAWEVSQAYIQFMQARTELRVWRDKIVPQARDAVTSAQLAINERGVSMQTVLETTRQFLSTRLRALEAEAQMRRSIAELERSVGRRLAGLDDRPADLNGETIHFTSRRKGNAP